jgi:hypothetical protein
MLCKCLGWRYDIIVPKTGKHTKHVKLKSITHDDHTPKQAMIKVLTEASSATIYTPKQIERPSRKLLSRRANVRKKREKKRVREKN